MRKINGKRIVLRPILATGIEGETFYGRTETKDLITFPKKWIAPESQVKLPGQKGKLVIIVPEGKELHFGG